MRSSRSPAGRSDGDRLGGTRMGIGVVTDVFDNRSLRTKIVTAVLAATLSGVLVGGLAIRTVGTMQTETAAAQRANTAILSASGMFAKNVEAFNGSLSAISLYPQLADRIKQDLATETAA